MSNKNNLFDPSRHTVEPPTVAGPEYEKTAAGDDPRIAEFLRLPEPGKRLFGCSRGFWNKRIEDGSVKAIRFRKKGSLNGVVLLVGESVRGFIRKEYDRQNGGEAEGDEAQ
jgi:hypothetical protein